MPPPYRPDSIVGMSSHLRPTIITLLIVAIAGTASLRLGPSAAYAQNDTRLNNRVHNNPDRNTPPAKQGNRSVTVIPQRTARAGTLKAIGINDAIERLGRNLPIGRDIIAGHVEGGATKYLPDAAGPNFTRVRFVPRSGPSTPFGHATVTAGIAYGRTGLAPGIEVVHSFSSLGWLTDDYLKLGTDQPPLQDDPIRVFSHSWISNEQRGVEQVLRRIDYQIDTRDIVMAVGVNNGADSEIPPALASAYNVIAVGTNTGSSSHGTTQVDGIGRSKPDIIAPGSMTSYSTPVAAAALAALLEAADHHETDPDTAKHSEVIKAALMTGATRDLDWERTPNRPLLDRYGAGLLNLDNALKILQSPPLELPSLTMGSDAEDPEINRRYGWAFESILAGQTRSITFKANRILGPVSIMTVWNRQIRGEVIRPPLTPKPIWLPRPLLSNIDIRLLALNEDGSEPTVYAESKSRLDNVEALYIQALPPGTYRLEITRHPFPLTYQPTTQEYALAWRIELPEHIARADDTETPEPDPEVDTPVTQTITR